MTEQRPLKRSAISLDLLRGMGELAGVVLTPERAAALGPQVEEHLVLLSRLNEVADSSTEPAAELRLDCWTPSGSD